MDKNVNAAGNLSAQSHLNQDTVPLGKGAGTTSYRRYLPFDKHYDKQAKLIDSLTERIQPLGGVSLERERMSRKQPQSIGPRRDRRELPDQLSRLLDEHKVIIGQARKLAQQAFQLGDERINDLVVCEVLRMNELQRAFLTAHIANVPFATAGDPSSDAPGCTAPASISDFPERARRRRYASSECASGSNAAPTRRRLDTLSGP